MMNRTNDNDMARTVRKAIDGYFRDLDGEKASGVYDMVIGSVEKPCSRACAVIKRTRRRCWGLTATPCARR